MRLALAVLLLLSECTPAPGPPDAGAPDAETLVDRRFYAMSDVQVVFDEDGGVQGVDLDGVDSAAEDGTCAAVQDDASRLDPSELGVDDSAAHILSQAVIPTGSTCASTADYACSTRVWREDIASGARIWVIEIAETGGVIEVALHRARTTGAPMLRAGRLAPGQAFALDELARTADAWIDGALLHARFSEPTDVELLLGSDVAGVVRVHRLEIAATLRDGAPVEGTIGGALVVDDLVAMVDPASADAIRQAIESLADLDPDPEDRTRCRQLSFGLGFETVAASNTAD